MGDRVERRLHDRTPRISERGSLVLVGVGCRISITRLLWLRLRTCGIWPVRTTRERHQMAHDGLWRPRPAAMRIVVYLLQRGKALDITRAVSDATRPGRPTPGTWPTASFGASSRALVVGTVASCLSRAKAPGAIREEEARSSPVRSWDLDTARLSGRPWRRYLAPSAAPELAIARRAGRLNHRTLHVDVVALAFQLSAVLRSSSAGPLERLRSVRHERSFEADPLAGNQLR